MRERKALERLPFLTEVLGRVPKGQSEAAACSARWRRPRLQPPLAQDMQNGAALGRRVGWLHRQRLYHGAELTASHGAPGARPLEDPGPWV